jgi:hypothetical protein
MLGQLAWRKLGLRIATAALLASGFAAGLAFAGLAFRDGSAQADVRRQPPEQHFKTGAQRSEDTLKEMAATLKSIDARLERMEKLAGRKLAGDDKAVIGGRTR